MNLELLLLVLILIGLLGILVLAWRARARETDTGAVEAVRRLESTIHEISRSVSETMATGMQSSTQNLVGAIGQIRQEVADRLQQGMAQVQEKMDRQLADGRKEQSDQLEKIRSKLDERLEGIGRQVQAKLDENLREGFKHFEKVQEHLRAAEEQLQNVATVGGSINELNNLLKLPHLRGGFGEASLDRLLADFLPAGSYDLQATVGSGSDRVDALIKFPRFRLPIDSKFPREQVLPLFETSDPAELKKARQSLAQVLKTEAKRIAKYVRPDDGTADMALMFLPSETLYFEAIRDLDLWGELSKLKVFPVSPNTLAITLKGVSISMDYYELARNVESTIGEIRKAQKHFQRFEERFSEVGRGLEKAQEAFSKASTHLGNYSRSVVRLSGETSSEDRVLSEPAAPPGPTDPS